MGIAAEDVFGQYLLDIRRHRLLTKQDEIDLSQAVEAGLQADAELQACSTDDGTELTQHRRGHLARVRRQGQAAQQEFVEANLRLVISIAKRYRSSGVPLEDLVQEGNLGLLRAVERFDWRRGFRFSTYASWWIRQSIAQGIRTSAHVIYRPAHVCDRIRAVQEAQRRLEVSLGRRPRPLELALDTGLAESQVVEVLGLLIEPRSLSEPSSRDGGDTPLADIIPDTSADPPFERLAAALLPNELARLLEPLDDRERLILGLRYGLPGAIAPAPLASAMAAGPAGSLAGLACDPVQANLVHLPGHLEDPEPLTLAAVAQLMQLTSQRISQITEGALAKLRHPSWRSTWEAVAADY
ncbi:MAG: sigma-70 family RNA polymerase sigma factor [Actinomycetota bacterium]|nr:sigma-70 family RNA polymerase sigma factor [Actinomycetota bacterium]